jgi:hypothetical protein
VSVLQGILFVLLLLSDTYYGKFNWARLSKARSA